MSLQEKMLKMLDEATVKLEAAEREKFEPIAIVGLEGRFPGAADIDGYWALLRDGVDAIQEVPESRWSLDDWYDPDPAVEGKIYTRFGGWLDDVDLFDAHFFGIAPREAQSLDPQQRLLLETSWHALERAGIRPSALKGSKTGVFVGVTTNDYAQLVREADAPLDAYFGSGNTLNAVAGRVSYLLGFQGPTMAVDTACSSSLTALHLACGALRRQECDTALAGGVNVILSAETTAAICRANMLAADGRCKSFSEEADGFVRSEGCGVLVLKRLSDAERDGDFIWATVRGTAVNQDGASSGFTVPNGPAQQAVIRQALAQARIEASAVSYIEAHGTGTSLGDPIEVGALAAVYGSGRSKERPLLLGSAKTNIGHAESAAGIAGVIKTVLALHHAQIPPHLHHDRPSSRIPWAELPIRVQTELTDWPEIGGTRVAGVSSFGMSGTNGHVILEEKGGRRKAEGGREEESSLVTRHSSFEGGRRKAEGGREEESSLVTRHSSFEGGRRKAEGGKGVLGVSGKTVGALRDVVARYEGVLGEGDVDWDVVCARARVSREALPHRLVLVAGSGYEAQDKLARWLRGETVAGIESDVASGSVRRKVGFLFTGQGSQYSQMGRDLYERETVFRESWDGCMAALGEVAGAEQFAGKRPHDVLDSALMGDLQPVLTALQISLARLWLSWGIRPDVMVGHSAGEIGLAHIAGVFGLADAVKLAAVRGRLMDGVGETADGGTMLAVAAGADTVKEVIGPWQGQVSLAALNGPESTVVSGLRSDLDEVAEAFGLLGVKARFLAISCPAHSPLMRPMVPEFEKMLRTIRFMPPQMRFVSTLTGAMAGEEVATAEYWMQHLLRPVRFAAAVERLPELGINTLIEIGPKPTLLGMTRRCLPDWDGVWLASLRADGDEQAQMLLSRGTFWAVGGVEKVDGNNHADDGRSNQPTPLPLYPFQRQRYWVDEGTRRAAVTDSAVVRALESGDRADLVQMLAGRLSQAEQVVLPKILALLEEMHLGEPDQVEGLYEIAWREKRPLGRLPAPDFIPAAATLEAHGLSHMNGVNRSAEVQAYVEFLAQLDGQVTAYVLAGLARAGWEWQVGQVFSAAQFAEENGILPKYGRMATWVLEIVADAGIVARDGESWRVIDRPDTEIGVLESVVTSSIEVEMLDRCGRAWLEVLRGEIDPLTLLFPTGGKRSAAVLYSDAWGARILNDLLAGVVQQVLADWPDGRPIRILEIGAGTGGSSQAILPLLPAERTEYVYTDVAAAFLRQGEKRFSQYGFIDYHRLDIEKAPEGQGLELARFDLIIGANVLHATRDLPRALGHVHELLAPGGQLLMIEGLAQMRWVDLIFGLTEGWWHWEDSVRQGHPLLTGWEWERVLRDSGFVEAAALATTDGVFARQGVVLARRAAALVSEQTEQNKRDGVGVDDSWLILGRGALSERVAERLAREGIMAITQETVNFEAMPQTLAGIVDCRACVMDERPLMAQVEQIQRDALGLVQGLAARGEGRPKLIWVTQAGQQGDVLAQTTLWGLRRTIELEHPEWQARLVDVDHLDVAAAGLAVVTEVMADVAEPEVFWRKNGRIVPRLVPHAAQKSGQLPAVDQDGSYLVTGGLGGLGLLVAEWLADRGAKQIALLGRSAPSEAAQEMIGRLEARGVAVQVCAADVGSRTEMAAVIDGLARPLRGVFHAAGALDDGILVQQSWDRFAKVLRAKVEGSSVLHALTADLELDFFVLFSSTVGTFGNAGQGNHAAANSFLPALAHQRQALGLPALCIDWGPWAAVGAVAQRDISLRGATLIEPEMGMRMMSTAMKQAAAQIVAVPLVLDELPDRPLFDELKENETRAGGATETSSSFMTQLADVSAKKRLVLIEKEIQKQATAVLGLDSGDWWHADAGFFDMGMDSLTAVEFRNRLQKRFERPLPTTLAFDYPTLAALTAYLAADGDHTEATGSGERPQHKIEASGADQLDNQQVEEELADLDEDELAALLDEELADLGD